VLDLTRFFGIIIAMYYNDHAPPHFHAKYGDEQASIRIYDGQAIEGALGGRALGRRWSNSHDPKSC
jgi:hypothetical protein